MKNKIIIILLILLSSCTKDLSIVDTNINYNPHIESIAMDSLFVLSETDTSFLEINVSKSAQIIQQMLCKNRNIIKLLKIK